MGLEMRRGFVPDHKEFGLHIRSEIARKPAVQVARKIAARANATATTQTPMEKRARQPKRAKLVHLKGSYEVVLPKTNLRVGRNTRAYAEVQSRVLEASTKEFGTRTQRPKRPLLRAAIAVSIEEFGSFDGRGPGPEGMGSGA